MAEELNIEDVLVGAMDIEAEDKEVKDAETVSDEITTIPVEPGDEVVIALQAQESKLIKGIKDVREGKLKPVKEDIIDVIDDTLALEVPAVDGAVVTIEIPEDADADALADVNLAVDDTVMADILTLVDDSKGE